MKQNVVVIPGTLTPSGVISRMEDRAGFVKVGPCGPAMGGAKLHQGSKGDVSCRSLIAAGGVSQRNAFSFIVSRSIALGIGARIDPKRSDPDAAGLIESANWLAGLRVL